MPDSVGLTWDEIAGRAGETFQAEAGDQRFDLELQRVERIEPPSPREGGSFMLTFAGPRDPILPQSTYRVSAEGFERDIFLVPTGQNATTTQYTATFY